MKKNTPSVAQAEGNWLAEVAGIWQKLSAPGHTPAGPEIKQALASHLRVSSDMAGALLNGFETLVSYAQAEAKADETALEEECQSVKVALQAVRPILERRLQERLDVADAKEEKERASCPGCGWAGKSEGRRNRDWDSTTGLLTLKRRYRSCSHCAGGYAPAEKVAGLPDSDFTARLEELSTLMATTVPHALAADLLREFLGLKISEQGVKSCVDRRAATVLRLQKEEAGEVQEYEKMWEKRPPWMEEKAPDRPIDVAYLELDGVIVMTREEKKTGEEVRQEGRGGPGRSYRVGGREIKNAVLYEGAACAQESERRGAILEKQYVSSLGSWLSLAVLVWVVMLKSGFTRARLLVVLSDGAEWIRSLCAWLPLPVLLILDLFHVKHRIWEMAGTLYGEKTDAAKAWARAQCERIEKGAWKEVVESLEFLKGSHPKARDQLSELQTYLRNNGDRMDYPRYREMGLRVGSGAVESANYHVTGGRLKLQGMRWSEEGAEQMAGLRVDLFNGVWRERSRQILMAA